MIKQLILSALCLFFFSGIAEADCGGVSSRQPIRSFFKQRQEARRTVQVSPTRTVKHTVAPTQYVTTSTTRYTVEPTYYQTLNNYSVVNCQPSRNSVIITTNCTDCQTITSQPMTTTDCQPIMSSDCQSINSQPYYETTNYTFGLGVATEPVQASQPVQQTFGLDAYTRAYNSAAYRAANGIKGHVKGELLTNRASSSGVGFATNNPNPRTCLGVPGRTSATCAVVKGADGWYSTCVRP